jgi:hypothetical protein
MLLLGKGWQVMADSCPQMSIPATAWPEYVEMYCDAVEGFLDSHVDAFVSEFADDESDVAGLTSTWNLTFASQFRYSLLATVITAAEVYAERVAANIFTWLRDRSPSRTLIGPTRLREGVFERSRLWLEAFASFSQPTEECWSSLQDLRELRNCVVHTGGVVSRSRSAHVVRRLAEIVPGVHVDEYGQLILAKECSQHCVEVLGQFVESLIDQRRVFFERVDAWE